jgi:hypothetical protein
MSSLLLNRLYCTAIFFLPDEWIPFYSINESWSSCDTPNVSVAITEVVPDYLSYLSPEGIVFSFPCRYYGFYKGESIIDSFSSFVSIPPKR